MYHVFNHYGPLIKESLQTHKRSGALISTAKGLLPHMPYGICGPGGFFIGPQQLIYEGMIVGQYSRDNDLVVNVSREKQVTNIRVARNDENIILTPLVKFSLEEALQFIVNDELVEVTV